MTKKEFVEKIYSNSTEDFKSKAHAEKVLTVIFETIKDKNRVINVRRTTWVNRVRI